MKKELLKALDLVQTASRAERNSAARYVIQHPESFPYLVELVFENSGRTSVKAAWVLELVCEQQIFLMQNSIVFFTQNLNRITDESTLRPLAKVCNYLTLAAYKDAPVVLLSFDEKEQITSFCFDLLINDHKIASQVFAMDSLLRLGTDHNWINRELREIISKNLPEKSAGYRSHAKKILRKLQMRETESKG